MYRNQGPENGGYVTETYLKAIAAAIPGADLRRALAERSSPAVARELSEDEALARAAGVHATPTFLLTARGGPARRLAPAGLDFGAFQGALSAAVR
jgi:protein-disulfide isomerase